MGRRKVADKEGMAKPKKISVEAAAKEWIELKTMEGVIETRRSELKKILEPALEKSPENIIELNGWKFLRLCFDKESFSLSKAKEKIDGRVLAPYITTSKVVQIRCYWKGGGKEELEAA
jgi:hypothetical protein